MAMDWNSYNGELRLRGDERSFWWNLGVSLVTATVAWLGKSRFEKDWDVPGLIEVAIGVVVFAVLEGVRLLYKRPHSAYVLYVETAKERDAAIANAANLQSRLNDSAPDFTSYINKMAIDDPVNGFCQTYLLVSVENIGGTASVLHNWRVYVQPPNGLESEIKTVFPDDDRDIRLVTDTSGNELRFNRAEFISMKAYPDGIEPGHACRGIYQCAVPAGLPDGTKFILRFRDARKRQYECAYDTAQRKDRGNDVADIGSWPGVNIRHVRVR